MEKIISTLNNLPLNELNQEKAKAEVVYLTNTSERTRGVKINANYQKRKGSENLFGDVATGVYPRIGTVEQLSVETTQASISGIYGNPNREGWSWFIVPRLEVDQFEMKYVDPVRLVRFSRVTGGVNLSGSISYKKSTFLVSLDGACCRNMDAHLEMAEINEKTKILITPIYLVFENLRTDNWISDVSFRWEHTLPKNKSVFLKLSWQHEAYRNDLFRENVQVYGGFIF